MLAEHPAEFALSGKVCTKPSRFSTTPFSVTNIGLRIELPLIPHPVSGFEETYIAFLDVGLPDDSSLLGIYVERNVKLKGAVLQD